MAIVSRIESKVERDNLGSVGHEQEQNLERGPPSCGFLSCGVRATRNQLNKLAVAALKRVLTRKGRVKWH